MMLQSNGSPGTPHLDFEAWKASLRSTCGRYHPEGIAPGDFLGWARPMNISGLAVMDIGWNARRVERTHRDVRLDGLEHYYALFQTSGESAVIQNNRVVKLATGDVVIVDSARPVTYFGDGASAGAGGLFLHLPRQSLISHLGFEPQGGSCGRSGTLAGRLLCDLVRDADTGSESGFSPADCYMQSAVYDLVGALFAPEARPVSRSTDKLFMRVCGLIRDGFSDPDFGPAEAAAAAGISLRYVQKLFTERGSTCGEFIYSLRLDRAAQLLRRHASLGTGQPLGAIAHACGFRDYAHFARKFRHRFGHAPGVHAALGQGALDGTVRAGTGESASSAHDVPPRAS